MSRKIKVIKLWLKKIRNSIELKEIWESLCRRINGYFQYCAVSDNYKSTRGFLYLVIELIYKWTTKRSMNWDEFNIYLKRYTLLKPRIIHSIY